MTVIQCGQEVFIGNGEISATVTAVFIRFDRVSYEVVWWDGRNRKCECLEACEVEGKKASTSVIGFGAVAELSK